ncbi:MAG: hypothetical protein CMJ48_11655 [Planctomycetaceae bacterium]|nr:hypothetical protein [Planctomycetaceae bacterium]
MLNFSWSRTDSRSKLGVTIVQDVLKDETELEIIRRQPSKPRIQPHVASDSQSGQMVDVVRVDIELEIPR